VPVASRNTSSGEMPDARKTFAFSVSAPLVAEHEFALVEDRASAELPLLVTVIGLAVIVPVALIEGLDGMFEPEPPEDAAHADKTGAPAQTINKLTRGNSTNGLALSRKEQYGEVIKAHGFEWERSCDRGNVNEYNMYNNRLWR
jgi:hypothetical protein